MAQTGWYNTNSQRHFPLVDNNDFPEYLFADIGLVVGNRHNFKPATESISVTRVQRYGPNQLFVEMTSDCPGLANHTILAFINMGELGEYPVGHLYTGRPGDLDRSGEVTQADFDSLFANIGLTSPTPNDGDIDRSGNVDINDAALLNQDIANSELVADVQGFIVLGDTRKIRQALPNPGDNFTGSSRILPGLVQTRRGLRADNITVATLDRTRADTAAGCRDYCWPVTADPYHVSAKRLTGSLIFEEGYNCLLRQSLSENSITIGAAVGSGAGQPCEETALFEGESPPTGSVLLSGGPACDEIFRTINGVGGRVVSLRGGQGVSVSYLNDTFTIQIDINAEDMAVCVPEISDPPPGCLPVDAYSSDQCECGPTST